MNKYPPHLLMAFIRFAEFGNITKASTSLGISQPALTRQLQQLDELADKKLFQKSGRQKKLSAVGQELFTQLKASWKDYDTFVDAVLSEFGKKPQRPFRVHGPTEILAHLSTRMKMNFPIIFTPVRSHEVFEKISNDDFNIGITRLIKNTDEFIAKKLFQENFYLVFPTGWKITNENFSAELLSKVSTYPVISYSEDFNFPKILAEKYRLKNISPNICTIPNWIALLQLVEKQVGWTVVPERLLPPNKKLMAVKIPAELQPPVTYYLIYKKSFSKVSWFKELIQNLTETYA